MAASLDASGKKLCVCFVDIVKLVVACHCHVCKLVDHILCSSVILDQCGAILGLSLENLEATRVQGHLGEMPRSRSRGPCAAK